MILDILGGLRAQEEGIFLSIYPSAASSFQRRFSRLWLRGSSWDSKWKKIFFYVPSYVDRISMYYNTAQKKTD